MEDITILKALADGTRLKIVKFLLDGEKCVCEIWKEFDLQQNLTSHHLKVLKDNKVLLGRRDGQKIFYKLNKKVMDLQISKLLKITKGAK